MKIPWSEVRRPDHGVDEEEQSDLEERLNTFIDQYRSTEPIVYVDSDGWGYHEEEK